VLLKARDSFLEREGPKSFLERELCRGACWGGVCASHLLPPGGGSQFSFFFLVLFVFVG
jgi:hypothetical protein